MSTKKKKSERKKEELTIMGQLEKNRVDYFNKKKPVEPEFDGDAVRGFAS